MPTRNLAYNGPVPIDQGPDRRPGRAAVAGRSTASTRTDQRGRSDRTCRSSSSLWNVQAMPRLPVPEFTVVAKSPDHRHHYTPAPLPHRGRIGTSAVQLRVVPATSGHRDHSQPAAHCCERGRGSDLLILSRTFLGGINQYDTNLVTLHRVPHFRALAPGPHLEPHINPHCHKEHKTCPDSTVDKP